MARLRTLKPGFFTNDLLSEVPPLGRLLFQGLWCLADREGRLEDRPKRIKAEVLPYDDVNVDDLLDALASRDFIARYQVGQARYIAVLNFGKHQNPHVKETASTIPAPGEHGASTVQAPDKNSTGTIKGDDEPGSSCLSSGLSTCLSSGDDGAKAPTRAKRATALPDGFSLSPEMREWAKANTPSIDADQEIGRFCDYCRANGKTYKDWPAAWRNWMGNAVTFAGKTRSNGNAANRRGYAEARLKVGAAGSFGDGGYDSWSDDPDPFSSDYPG